MSDDINIWDLIFHSEEAGNPGDAYQYSPDTGEYVLVGNQSGRPYYRGDYGGAKAAQRNYEHGCRRGAEGVAVHKVDKGGKR